ncbi:MAG: CBS domain-containing protein [Actinomycetota bacterium]
MQVREVMTPDVVVIGPHASIRDAARRMRDRDVGCLPIADEGGRLLGIVTDRDIAVRAVADNRNPAQTTVRECMSTDLVWVHDDLGVEDAAEMMEREQVRRLPVLDREQRLVGILSLGDISTRTTDRRLAGEVTREVSQPLRH